jgi:hypothetical protein
MFFKPRPPAGNSHHASVTDLQDIGQRSLIRIIFATTHRADPLGVLRIAVHGR